MAENSTAQLQQEISGLQSQYGVCCSVKKNVGNFKHVVHFTPENMDLSITFQLPDNYPNVAPDICIKSNNINPSAVDELTNNLTLKSKELVGNPMIEILYQAGKSWLEEKKTSPLYKNSSARYSSDEISSRDDDESSDDEVVDHIDGVKAKTVKKGSGGDVVDSKSDGVGSSYFLCIRVTDPEIQEAVMAMQEAILEVEPSYAEHCISLTRLNITLCNVDIDGKDQEKEACRILGEMHSNINKMARSGLEVILEGVDCFGGKVLHVKIQENQEFLEFVNQLKILLRERGINIQDKPELLPHMPILKSKKTLSSLMKKNNLDLDLYGGFEDLEFGCQKVYEIHLCSTQGGGGEDGFYTSLVSIPVGHQKSSCNGTAS